MPIAIECRTVAKQYVRGGFPVDVLAGVDLEVETGGFLALMGPSGSGKSTLLHLIGGLDAPTSGEIRVGGRDLLGMSARELAAWRASTVGYVFQFYNLLPILDAQRNVELPLLLTSLSRSQRRERAATALELVGLRDRADHRPGQLSGGQQQRVAIARAIVADPDLLLCDEPTGDLDRSSAGEVLELLRTLNQDLGKTVVMVTHDPQAADHAGRVLHLDKGRLAREALQ